MGRSGSKRTLALTIALVLAAVAMPLVTAGAAPTTLDFEVTTGTYTSLGGVTFPRAIEVFNCTAAPCAPAHSGTRAARGELFGEFEREPFEARFSTPMAHVQLYVKNDDAGATSTENIQVTLSGFNDPVAGAVVDSETKTFQAGSGWNLFQVGDPNGVAAIDRVVLSGGSTVFASNTNFLSVDDLAFDPGASPSPTPTPTADTQPPVVTIFEPAEGATRTVRSVFVNFQVAEDVHLNTVVGRVENSTTGEVVANADFCGSSFSGGCPVGPPFPIVLSRTQTIDLAGVPNGSYRVEIEGCDLAGNCGLGIRNFTLNVEAPPPTVDVIPFRMEVNQGVQTVLHQLEGPGTIAPLSVGVGIVPEKETLVRFYLFGDEAVAEDFTGRLRLDLEMRDGTRRGDVIDPNAGATTVDAPIFPGTSDERRRALAGMRADLSQTLNFVIPEEILTSDVRIMDMRLRQGSRSLTGVVQLRLGAPLRLGMNIVELSGLGIGSGTPPAPLEQEVIPYLEDTFPVSEVRVVSTRSMSVPPGGIYEGIMGSCGWPLYTLWAAYGTDDAPVGSFTSDPSILPTVGIADYGTLGDASGCAYVGGGLHTSSDDFERVGGTSVNTTFADTVAQEIGHSLGLIHASNAHDELDGGDAEDWPHPHGTIGERSYGVILRATTPPSDTDPEGQWNPFLLDPCPTTVIDERYPECTVDDGAGHTGIHDFMSYGGVTIPIGPYISAVTWISGLTNNRIRGAIQSDAHPGPFDELFARRASAQSDPSAGLERIDALLIDGVVAADGTVTFLPVIRKPMPAAMTRGIDSGPYKIQLVGSEGILFQRSFETLEVTTHDAHVESLQQVVPYVPGVEEVVLLKDGVEIGSVAASPNAPTVQVTGPEGGAVFENGQVTVQWTQSDADGDPLYALVQYSPDGGWSWQGVQLVTPGSALSATFPVAEMIPGNHALVRVVVSDGLNTSVDVSDTFFSVGTMEPAGDDQAESQVTLRLRKHLRASGLVSVVDGPTSCAELARVVIKRNGKKVKATTTSITGRYRVRLPDRAGSYTAVLKTSVRGVIACAGDSSAEVVHAHR